ncbi:phosphatase PAP2 family protein [Microbacterium algeriense]|uniref:phosphatase PAP2 family protein n=1 Tax=Microbacterium algeriense TaxID=2615184 RepID=UPI0029A7914C|nr:phosphatase PAP2 family protein [Microbacterium algeriense]MDX2401296.1 phosphatase PAP2 family protein [Microbacterium algeriense]
MSRRTLLWWGVSLLVLATALGAVVVFVYPQSPGFDRWWNETIAAARADWMLDFALALNWIGGGWVAILGVPLLAILALVLARRWRGAVFAAVSFLASAGAVQLLKTLFGRARPDDMLVVSDYGSFPSGHTANAATIALVLWVLFPRVWVAIVGALWVLAMALSRTFLSVHWATDTLGGALVGAGVVLVLAAWLLPWVQRKKHALDAPIG